MLSLIERTVDLGTDGAKWAHGYVPLNAAAVAIKEHRKPGHAGKPIPSLAKAKKPRSASGLLADSRRVKLETINGKDARSMTPAQKVAAVRHMYGDGSKQHLSAAKKEAAKSAKVATVKKVVATKRAAPKAEVEPKKVIARENVKKAREVAKVAEARAVGGKSRKSAGVKHVDKEVNRQVEKLKLKEPANENKPAEKHVKTNTSNKALYKLNNQDLEHELSVAKQRGDTEHANTLRVELAQRKEKIAQVLKQSHDAKEFVREELPKVEDPAVDGGKSMNKFLRGLTKIMPSLKPRLDKIAKSKVSKRVREIKYFDAIIESAFQTISDHIVGGLVTGAASGLGITIFSGGRG